MKWHKFDPGFWDSHTHDVLESQIGDRGILIYLRLLSRLALDLQTADDVQYCHEFGWEKSLKDWARIAKYRSDLVERTLTLLQHLDKLTMEKDTTSGALRINIKFKNLREFIHKDALSSKMRKGLHLTSGGPPGRLLAGKDKIREEKNPPTPHELTRSIGQIPSAARRSELMSQSEFEKERERQKRETERLILEERRKSQISAPIASAPQGPGEG